MPIVKSTGCSTENVGCMGDFLQRGLTIGTGKMDDAPLQLASARLKRLLGLDF